MRYELRPKKQLMISKVAVYEMSTRNKAEPAKPKKQLTIYTRHVSREK